MLEKVDGVILAVHDANAAAETFAALFDAKKEMVEHSNALGADVTFLRLGTDHILLAVPTADGLIADHITTWGEGIVGVAFAAKDPAAVAKHVESRGVSVTDDDGAWLIDPSRTHGLLTLLVPFAERESVGAISFLYEVTHLVADWQAVSDFWTEIFGLEGAKFSPISSKEYGYDGTLTLFDPPAKLDRIEVVYPHDAQLAMGRFFVKRGEGPYMFFMETDDMPAVRDRLNAAGARFAPKEEPEQPNSLFVHPSSTHGVLIGVSPKNLAWVWSGRPELARARD